ncbi:hypothetical protein [Streptomyces sp. NPDC050504]|uniref:hypothetical protein n=1 Tax=Streptomyces sp. NPDC050504 TaxID=3365618 RepID=UPI0037BC915E
MTANKKSTAASKEQKQRKGPKEPKELRLVKEAKLQELIGKAAGTRLEASGVLYRDGVFLVVCDNFRDLIRVGSEISPKAPENGLLSGRRTAKGAEEGYEDLAHDPVSGHYYALTEAVAVKPTAKDAKDAKSPKDTKSAKGAKQNGAKSGGFRARVREYDERLRPGGSSWLDFPLPDAGKGMEGLECVERAGTVHLLGLCEGNRCATGAEGREPGGGRVQVFRRGKRSWEHLETLKLPASVPFEDYASLSVRGDKLAVLSQASSALWVGRLAPDAWRVVDEGTVYRLPRDAKGRTVYGNPEGVCWVSSDHVVVVSDRAKKGPDSARHRTKDQSIHLFLVPGNGD